MNFVLWTKKLTKKISTRNLAFAIFGKILVIFALGTLFSAQLEFLTKIFLFLGLALTIVGLTNLFLTWHSEKPLRYIDFFLSFFGTFLLTLYFGTLYPNIPYKISLLVLGVLLIMPGLVNLFRK